MKIIFLKIEDIFRVLPIIKEHYEDCEAMHSYSFKENDALISLNEILRDSDYGLFGVEEDEKIVGIGAMVKMRTRADFTHYKADEVFWFVSRKFNHSKRVKLMIELFDRMIEWAKGNGCKTGSFGVPKDSGLNKFLSKRGFVHTENFHTRGVL